MIKLSVPFVVFVAKASIVVGLDQVSAKATVRYVPFQAKRFDYIIVCAVTLT